eukprot:9503381-Pyramimonas_sp.AAC.1
MPSEQIVHDVLQQRRVPTPNLLDDVVGDERQGEPPMRARCLFTLSGRSWFPAVVSSPHTITSHVTLPQHALTRSPKAGCTEARWCTSARGLASSTCISGSPAFSAGMVSRSTTRPYGVLRSATCFLSSAFTSPGSRARPPAASPETPPPSHERGASARPRARPEQRKPSVVAARTAASVFDLLGCGPDAMANPEFCREGHVIEPKWQRQDGYLPILRRTSPRE